MSRLSLKKNSSIIISPIASELEGSYISMVGWVLWRINYCGLFNAKFCLYILTKKFVFVNVKFVDNIFKQARVHLFAHTSIVPSIDTQTNPSFAHAHLNG